MVNTDSTPSGQTMQLPVNGKAAPNLAEALQQAGCDRPVFPCREAPGEPYTDKKTGELKTPQVKQPYTHAGKDDATTDPATIRSWWKRWPGALVGINLEKSGLFALDVDTHEADKDGYKTLSDLLITHAGGQPLPKGPAQRTINGGEHRLFRRPIGVRLPGKLGPGLDIKYRGYICTGELPDGRKYEPIEGCELTQEAPEAPAWMVEMFRNMTRDTASDQAQQRRDLTLYDDKEKWADSLLKRLHPSRCDTYADWINVGMALTSLGSAGLTLWDNWSRNSAKYQAGACDDKWDTFKAGGLTLGSLYHWAEEDSPSPRSNSNGHQVEEPEFPPMDGLEADNEENYLLMAPADHAGHADCVTKMFPGKFLYVEAYGWLAYNGKFYQREAAESELGKAIEKTLRGRRATAAAAEKYDLVKACHASNGNVAGTRDRLKDRVTELVDRFDNAPDQLNCNNGVLDLRTGALAPHSDKQRFTYCLPVDYDPKADRGPWLAFLQAALGSVEMVDYLQAALGYSLTGQTWEEIMFYLYGPPRSGKGTFTETIIAMLGNPLAVEADFQTFTADRGGDTQNFDLAPLKPCRFVAAAESNKNQPLNPAKIKALTGRNYVRCAFKHRDHFQYQPAFKIWLSSNHPVNVDVDDDAAWGRVRVIDFPNSHLGSEDKSLKAKLTTPEVLRGVLAWAVEGAQLWYELVKNGGKGLPVPQQVARVTQEQRDQQDNVKAFLSECCADDPDGYIPSGEMYQGYKTWCENNGVSPKLLNQFAQSVAKKGYGTGKQRKIGGRNIRTFTGLKLLS